MLYQTLLEKEKIEILLIMTAFIFTLHAVGAWEYN